MIFDRRLASPALLFGTTGSKKSFHLTEKARGVCNKPNLPNRAPVIVIAMLGGKR